MPSVPGVPAPVSKAGLRWLCSLAMQARTVDTLLLRNNFRNIVLQADSMPDSTAASGAKSSGIGD